MFGGLGMGEMILIFLVVLLLFGAKRLPEIGSSLGKGIREFKSSVREIEGELKQPRYPPPPPPPPQEARQLPQATQAPAPTTGAAQPSEKQTTEG
jgi:sec-independent protein translocase protein TatA